MCAIRVPPEEMPRERLFSMGPSSLSNVELLAILLRTGSGRRNVMELAEQVLEEFHDLQGLSRATDRELLEIDGMGRVKVASLMAVVELAKRLAAAEVHVSSEGPKWRGRLHWWTTMLSLEEREFIAILFLDRRDRVIGEERLSYGGLDGAALDVRYFLRKAIRLDAWSVVVMHNHPDGCPEISAEDRMLTHYLKEQLEILDIVLLGHFIIAGGETRSIPLGSMKASEEDGR